MDSIFGSTCGIYTPLTQEKFDTSKNDQLQLIYDFLNNSVNDFKPYMNLFPMSTVDVATAKNVRNHLESMVVIEKTKVKGFDGFVNLFENFVDVLNIQIEGLYYSKDKPLGMMFFTYSNYLCAWLWIYICLKSNVHDPELETTTAFDRSTVARIDRIGGILNNVIVNMPPTVDVSEHRENKKMLNCYSFMREIGYCLTGNEEHVDSDQMSGCPDKGYIVAQKSYGLRQRRHQNAFYGRVTSDLTSVHSGLSFPRSVSESDDDGDGGDDEIHGYHFDPATRVGVIACNPSPNSEENEISE